MNLVIKIPDEVKETFDNGDVNFCFYDYNSLIGRAIRNGTPLPKGRGRLLILDEECVNANLMKIGNWSCQKWISEVGISNSVVTIIEADKVESEDEKYDG